MSDAPEDYSDIASRIIASLRARRPELSAATPIVVVSDEVFDRRSSVGLGFMASARCGGALLASTDIQSTRQEAYEVLEGAVK